MSRYTSPLGGTQKKFPVQVSPNFEHIPIANFTNNDVNSEPELTQIWRYCYALFTLWPFHEYIALDVELSVARHTWLMPLLLSGLAQKTTSRDYHRQYYRYGADNCDHHVYLSRSHFWQGAGPFKAQNWIPALGKIDFSRFPVPTFREQQLVPGLSETELYHGKPEHGVQS